MHVIQIAPLMESVPPRFYGGTERIVSYLTEELVAQGYQVSLFATGDSQTSSKLIPIVPTALRLSRKKDDNMTHYFRQIEEVYRYAASVTDPVLHFHIDYFHFPISRRMHFPQFTTMHGRLDLPDSKALYEEFPDMPLVSISNAQRLPLPDAQWLRTVYHGIPPNLYRLGNGAGKYLAFVGRISPEKRVDRAIEISRRCGIPLKIAAKVDPGETEYFEKHVQPLLGQPGVEFLGEISEKDKQRFFGDAIALLFPIDWPEPFGLVMIEAMACGTPVIAYGHGSVPEIIRDGINGRIVHDTDGAVAAVTTIDRIDRQACRDDFVHRFSSHRMVSEYGWLYRSLSNSSRSSA